jgi:hypothetical protein
VTLGDGLEEIGASAFGYCTSMEEIVVPPTVRDINDTAFESCRNLTRVRFCPQVEAFVSCEAMSEWWNQGLHEKSLSTYCFLVRCNIIERLHLVQVTSWRVNVYDMLRRIPTISKEGATAYLDTIDAKLTLFESLKDSPGLLELVIWKSKLTNNVTRATSISLPTQKRKRVAILRQGRSAVSTLLLR